MIMGQRMVAAEMGSQNGRKQVKEPFAGSGGERLTGRRLATSVAPIHHYLGGE
jgi:hypothetical protein